MKDDFPDPLAALDMDEDLPAGVIVVLFFAAVLGATAALAWIAMKL